MAVESGVISGPLLDFLESLAIAARGWVRELPNDANGTLPTFEFVVDTVGAAGWVPTVTPLSSCVPNETPAAGWVPKVGTNVTPLAGAGCVPKEGIVAAAVAALLVLLLVVGSCCSMPSSSPIPHLPAHTLSPTRARASNSKSAFDAPNRSITCCRSAETAGAGVLEEDGAAAVEKDATNDVLLSLLPLASSFPSPFPSSFILIPNLSSHATLPTCARASNSKSTFDAPNWCITFCRNAEEDPLCSFCVGEECSAMLRGRAGGGIGLSAEYMVNLFVAHIFCANDGFSVRKMSSFDNNCSLFGIPFFSNNSFICARNVFLDRVSRVNNSLYKSK